MSEPRATGRAWARAIYDRWGDLDGLLVESTMTAGRNVVLFDRAGDSFGDSPSFSRSLTTPDVATLLAEVADEVGYVLL